MYSQEEIVEELRKADKQVDGPLTQGEFNELSDMSYAAPRDHFGGWNAAKREVGLETNNYGRGGKSAGEKRRMINQIREEMPCAKCGGDFPRCAMDFHHVSGEKTRSVSRMFSYTWGNIKNELRKCIVVCANCHRQIEHGELN